MKVGIQGIPGSYSSYAAVNFFPKKDYDLESYEHFTDLINDLADNKLDYAVIPVENSTTGSINRTIDHIRYKDIYAINEIYIPIRHALIGLPGTNIKDIERAYSHAEAISQCENFFKNHPGISPVTYPDTADAVVYVKEAGMPHQAALASEYAANYYGMEILASNVQDAKNNHTRFLLFTTQPAKIDKDKRFTIYSEIPHEPGSLVEILNILSLADINLSNLVTRPTADRNFTYGFFIEGWVSDDLEDFNNAIKWIMRKSTYFREIGYYDEGEVVKKNY